MVVVENQAGRTASKPKGREKGTRISSSTQQEKSGKESEATAMADDCEDDQRDRQLAETLGKKKKVQEVWIQSER